MTESESRARILNGLYRSRAFDYRSGFTKASLGRLAFPDARARTPQGAAFSVAALARRMRDEGLLSDWNPNAGTSWYLTPKGMRAAETREIR